MAPWSLAAISLSIWLAQLVTPGCGTPDVGLPPPSNSAGSNDSGNNPNVHNPLNSIPDPPAPPATPSGGDAPQAGGADNPPAVSGDSPPDEPDPQVPCDPNPDPLGLAGPHTIFVNNCTEGTSIVPSNDYTREQAMNPFTPLRDPFGLRLTDADSKLVGATASDPVGDTVYFRRGTYSMPQITVWNRVVFLNEHRISLKAYPGEQVTIRGSSFVPGGTPPNTFCNPTPGQGICTLNHMFQFWFCNDVTIEGITFVGNTQETVQIAGQNVTGTLCAPYVLRFWGCDRLKLKDVGIRDFVSAADIGLGHRYQLDPVYMNTEYLFRGLTVSYAAGLEMDHVHLSASSDDPATVDLSAIPWDLAGFITESLVGDVANPVHVHDSEFRNCPGNAVEFSTVTYPQNNVIFEDNTIDTWKNGIQVGGDGLSEYMTFRNNRLTYNRHVVGIWGSGGYGLKIGNSNHVSVINNVFYNGDHNAVGILLRAGRSDDGQFYTIDNTLIAHNTLYRAGMQSISLLNEVNPDDAFPDNAITNTRVYNNLLYQVNMEAAQGSNLNNNKRELSLQFLHFEENSGFANVFRNNLLVPARSDGKTVGSADFGYWLLNGGSNGNWQCYVDPALPGCGWFTCGPNAGCLPHSRYKYDAAGFNALQPYAQNNIQATASDPMFANVAANDFHLAPGSPAVNHAQFLPEVPTDINGVSRSNGGCSIGAYEPQSN